MEITRHHWAVGQDAIHILGQLFGGGPHGDVLEMASALGTFNGTTGVGRGTVLDSVQENLGLRWPEGVQRRGVRQHMMVEPLGGGEKFQVSSRMVDGDSHRSGGVNGAAVEGPHPMERKEVGIEDCTKRDGDSCQKT